jgi:hypothetical protein
MEESIDHLKILSRHLPQETDDAHEKWPVSGQDSNWDHPQWESDSLPLHQFARHTNLATRVPEVTKHQISIERVYC